MLSGMYPRTARILPVMGLLLCGAVSAEDADWPESVTAVDTARVNEGSLVFLAAAPERRVLQTRNRLTIGADSLASGWVALEQCQRNLDPVAAVEIVYRYHGLRGLRVASATAMDSAHVAGNSVQLSGVRPGGEVCIVAEVQVLKPDGAGGYRLQSGPFHRRFLDGYYPLALDYRVEWPAGRLVLVSVVPAAQEGFAVQTQPGSLQIDTLFEGRLTIELQFEPFGNQK